MNFGIPLAGRVAFTKGPQITKIGILVDPITREFVLVSARFASTPPLRDTSRSVAK